MGYLIYGKHTEQWCDTKTGKWYEPDKTFAPLDWNGKRLTKKNERQNAFEYATREDAQERLDAVNKKKGTAFEIRKAK